MNLTIRLLAATAVGFAPSVFAADDYVGVNYLSSLYAYEDTNPGSGFQALFMRRWQGESDRSWQAELSYLDAGEADIDDPQAFGLDALALGYEGFNLSLGMAVATNPGSRSKVWLRGGLYGGKAVLSGRSGSATGKIRDDASGAFIGIGLDWMFRPSIGLRLAYDTQYAMEDFANDEDLGIVKIGLIYRLDGGAEPMAAAISASAEEPARAMPAPQEPAAADAPEARLPRLLAGMQVPMRGEGTIWSRPVPGSASLAQLQAATVVELISELRNTSGTWWFVRAGNQQGWVLASQLVEPS